jgi:hypothetical protein
VHGEFGWKVEKKCLLKLMMKLCSGAGSKVLSTTPFIIKVRLSDHNDGSEKLSGHHVTRPPLLSYNICILVMVMEYEKLSVTSYLSGPMN